MVAIKLRQFGGTIPAVDVRLLPDNQAEVSDNTWLYSGSIAGIAKPTAVYTLKDPATRKAFRIPIQYYDKEHIPDSYWMEFEDPDTDVIKSPTVDDTFERFYWASSALGPRYNTKARIIAGNTGANAPFLLGIPAPTTAPRISRVNGKYYFSLDAFTYSLKAGSTKLYETVRYGLDRGSFQTGALSSDGNPGMYGSTYVLRASGGVTANIDRSAIFVSNSATNAYRSTGFNATIQYGTTAANSSPRVTIDDAGTRTNGVPAQSINEPAYVGQGVLETRAYVYTWVSAYGEEGPPSPPTLATGYSGDPWYVGVTAPTTTDTTNRNLSKVRIYRTVTGIGGTTTYFFVAEMPIATLSYEDRNTDDTIASNSILESTYWTAPPSDLQGIISMPNGMIAGFRKNEIWFCEPYRPHAWPGSYAVAVETPIVGLGVVGQTLIVLTNTAPYAITGINPSVMAISRLKQTEPCLSRGSIVSTSAGVAYASPNGVAMATPGEVVIVSRSLISKDKWLDLVSTDTLRACSMNGAYYGWGSVSGGCFEPTAFNTSAFLQIDFSGAYSGILMDVNEERIAVNSLSNTLPVYNAYMDSWTGEVLLVTEGKVMWLDISQSRERQAYTWKSKVFEMPNRRNLEALRIWYSTFSWTPAQGVQVLNPTTLAANMHGIVKVYADDRLVMSREMRTSGEFMRIPSGFKATYWQIEVQSRVQINSIETSTAAKELVNV